MIHPAKRLSEKEQDRGESREKTEAPVAISAEIMNRAHGLYTHTVYFVLSYLTILFIIELFIFSMGTSLPLFLFIGFLALVLPQRIMATLFERRLHRLGYTWIENDHARALSTIYWPRLTALRIPSVEDFDTIPGDGNRLDKLVLLIDELNRPRKKSSRQD